MEKELEFDPVYTEQVDEEREDANTEMVDAAIESDREEAIPTDMADAADDLQFIDLENNKNNPHKFASVRFYVNDKVIYRFDLWTTVYRNDYNRLIEIKDIINNFDEIRPDSTRKFKDFFAVVGVVRYTFPKTMIPVSLDIDNKEVCVVFENSINQYIKYAKLKKMRIEINPEE